MWLYRIYLGLKAVRLSLLVGLGLCICTILGCWAVEAVSLIPELLSPYSGEPRNRCTATVAAASSAFTSKSSELGRLQDK